nr:hypothetical protein [Tanacetum cinerariifolium]
MWEAIERLQQGESLNNQDVKTNLFWEFGKFTSHDGESMESYYTRFYKLMNEMIRNNLTVTTFQKIYKPTNNNLITSSNSKNKNVDTTPRYKNDDHSGQFGNQRTVNVAAERDKVGSTIVQKSMEFNVLTARNMDILQRNAKSQKGLRTPRTTRRRCCCASKLSKVFHFKPNSMIDSGTDSEPVEQVLNKAENNVFANVLQHSEQSESTKHSKDLFRALTALDIEILIQTCLIPLAIKTQGDSLKFVHELKQEMHSDLKYVESLEKEINELKSEKAEFLDMYDVILHDCVKKSDCLAQKLSKQTKSVSKEVHTDLLQCFAKVEKHSISLEIALQNCKEQLKNNTVCNEKASNVFRKEREQYFEIQDLKAQMQDKNIAISELKKLIKNGKGKSVDTKFDTPSVVRQPNAQRIPKPSVLGKPAPFSNSLDRIYFQKTRSVPKANVSEGLSKPVTAQTLPHTTKKAE